MSETAVRVLVVDDSRTDFLIVSHELDRIKTFPVDVKHCAEAAECRAALDGDQVDCVLLDYMLGADSGLEVLASIREAGFDHPVIMLTGQGDEQVAVEAMKRGAQDYLVKDGITHLVLRRAIANAAEKVALARRLREQREELEAFVSVVAHDLRNPIFAAHGSLEVIRDFYRNKPLDDKAWGLLEGSMTSLERMSRLIETLLEYAVVGRSGSLSETVDLNEIVLGVLSDLRAVIAGCEARIETGELPCLVGDHVTLAQLIQNLVANALKFRGDASPVIKISSREEDGGWVFSVADNGIGVDPQNRLEVFKPFHRLHSRDKYDGSGIGLATCQRIVERHGGRIWVESEISCGSTFSFWLPERPYSKRNDSVAVSSEEHVETPSIAE